MRNWFGARHRTHVISKHVTAYDRDASLGHLRNELVHAPGVVRLDTGDDVVEYEISSLDGIEALQTGYGIGPAGEQLMTGDPGSWRPEWYVIGFDVDLGDPVFVDLSEPQFPVFTAAHGAGRWTPEPLAPSLNAFFDA